MRKVTKPTDATTKGALQMIHNFDDFCLLVYAIVDDICQQLEPFLRRPGPVPVCSNSELIVLCLIGECKGWDMESELLSNISMRRLFNSVRQIIETVNGQLTEQFHIETNHAHSFWGLCARLYTKLTAHTLCIYINRLLGNPDFLHIKALAFPI
jgi:hypothetical protein